MATLLATFPPAGTATHLSVGAGASSALQTPGGTGFLFLISADQDLAIAFGTKGVLTAATATDFYIPAKTVLTFDTGQFDSFAVWNLSASSANVTYLPLSRS